MIEVPAAIYQIAMLAEKVDFFSVGTNDLAQYLLATDRDDSHGAARFEVPHPALLQALHLIVDQAHRAGKPVTVCGEIAGDPAIALVLLGMGFDALSMGPAVLPKVKAAIRGANSIFLRDAANEALRCRTKTDIEQLLRMVRTRLVETASLNHRNADSVGPAAQADRTSIKV